MNPIAYIHAAGGIGPEGDIALDLFKSERTPLAGDARPIPLRELGKLMKAQVPRLTTRYVELAVLGARLIDKPIAPSTRLYVGTGMGEIVTVDAMYHQVVPPCGEMVMPARFASSGNNMAAFFVARQAGLVSRNMTVSQEELSFEVALRMACDDLAANATRSALVGALDETATPREFYLSRFPIDPDRVIGEGSAWVLLSKDPDGAIGALLDASIFVPDADGHVLEANRHGVNAGGETVLLPGMRIGVTEIARLERSIGATSHFHYLQHTGYFPTAAGLALVGSFKSEWPGPTTFIHLNRDGDGRCARFAWRVHARVRPPG